MIRRPPRSTLSSSSAASDVYKRQNIKSLSKRYWTSSAIYDLYFFLKLYIVILYYSLKKEVLQASIECSQHLVGAFSLKFSDFTRTGRSLFQFLYFFNYKLSLEDSFSR